MTPLEHAISQLGVKEQRGNRGIPFARYAFQGEYPLPWCARGMRWCFIQAGTPLPGNRWLIGNVRTMREELEKRGAIVPVNSKVLPGDLLFIKDRGDTETRSGEHVAMVESIGGLTINSIDFNWRDSVERVARERFSPAIKCLMRWPVSPMA